MATFPLKCTICSAEHSYSDISHLLTHISSKRHLSTYFNTTVRARQDPTLARNLHQFDCWYNQNNLEQLLAERLSKKDDKKLGLKIPRTKTSYGNKRNIKKEELPAVYPEQQHHELPDWRNEAILNLPIASHMLIKEEPDLYTENTLTQYNFPLQRPPYEPYAPEHSSYEQPWRSFESPAENEEIEYQESGYPWLARPTSLAHSGSILYRDQPLSELQDTNHLNNEFLPLHGNDSPSTINDIHHQDGFYAPTRSKTTMLKGIVWPGMLLFDAASPNSKRMRNQKKNYATARMLERLSEKSHPTEVIYHQKTWKVKEKRPIDGEVHSPLPELKPRPRGSKQRRVLKEISTNRPSRKRYHFRQKLSDEVEEQSSPIQPRRGISMTSSLQHGPFTLSDDKIRRGLFHGLETYHGQHDDFSEQYPATTYPFLSNPSYVRGEPMTGNAFQTHGKQQLGSPASLNVSNTEANSFRSTLDTKSVTSEQIFFKSELDESPENCLPNPNCPLGLPRIHESLPPIATFNDFYYTAGHEGHQNSAAAPLMQTQNQQVEQLGYQQDQSYPYGSMGERNLNGPKTPTRAICNYENYTPNIDDTFEDSSGDETIDQGVYYTPTRYLTRSAARLTGRVPA